MGSGGREGSDDGRRARKALRVDGLIKAIDWLEANEPRRSGIWDAVGRNRRRRPGALVDRVRELCAADPSLWTDIDRALREMTDAITDGLRRDLERGDDD